MLKHFSQKIRKVLKQLLQNESKFPAKVCLKNSLNQQNSLTKSSLKSLLQELHYILLAGVCLRHRVRATLG